MSKHSKCTDTYEKIDEAALWDMLLFLSIFNLLGYTPDCVKTQSLVGDSVPKPLGKGRILKKEQKKKRYARIAWINGWIPMIWMALLRLKARKASAISPSTFCLPFSKR